MQLGGEPYDICLHGLTLIGLISDSLVLTSDLISHHDWVNDLNKFNNIDVTWRESHLKQNASSLIRDRGTRVVFSLQTSIPINNFSWYRRLRFSDSLFSARFPNPLPQLGINNMIASWELNMHKKKFQFPQNLHWSRTLQYGGRWYVPWKLQIKLVITSTLLNWTHVK